MSLESSCQFDWSLYGPDSHRAMTPRLYISVHPLGACTLDSKIFSHGIFLVFFFWLLIFVCLFVCLFVCVCVCACACVCVCKALCAEGKVRLTGGSATSGRVEVCAQGLYRTVCHDGWDSSDAAVVCRQLHQSSTGKALSSTTKQL